MMHLARRILIGSLVVGGSFVVTQSAEAGFIDFGSAAWAPSGAKQSVSVGGITVTATAPKGSDLSWTSGLGFGVDSSLVDELLGTGDEINSVEILSVTMPTATTISGFTVSNLFTESLLGLLKYSEVGYYSINGGQWTQFVAPGSNTQSTNGLLSVSFAPSLVSSIAFGYGGGGSGLNDFSVKGINVVSTPEPTSLLLMGTGLAALVVRARKSGPRRTAT